MSFIFSTDIMFIVRDVGTYMSHFNRSIAHGIILANGHTVGLARAFAGAAALPSGE